MKAIAATAASGILLLLLGPAGDTAPVPSDPARAAPTPITTTSPSPSPFVHAAALTRGGTRRPAPEASPGARITPPEISPADLTAYVHRLCAICHSDQLKTGNLSLQHFDVARAPELPETAEKMIGKLRAGMMPPPGIPRAADTLQALVETLERLIDEAAAANPNPGGRTFQRLNRAEYERSIDELLGLKVDAGDWLPLDTKSANFDNIADVQMLSPTLMDGYLRAATRISQLALG
ncbi:MAG: DUF1587 domain-containing protein, partial [Longimicrobiales bacterium]